MMTTTEVFFMKVWLEDENIIKRCWRGFGGCPHRFMLLFATDEGSAEVQNWTVSCTLCAENTKDNCDSLLKRAMFTLTWTLKYALDTLSTRTGVELVIVPCEDGMRTPNVQLKAIR